jgi:sulfur carrier protein
MHIKVNGRDETINEKMNITGLLAGRGVKAERIVVEYNFRILRKEEWPAIVLRENDAIEIISFMGGG